MPDRDPALDGLPPIVRDDEDAALWAALEALASGRAQKFKEVRLAESIDQADAVAEPGAPLSRDEERMRADLDSLSTSPRDRKLSALNRAADLDEGEDEDGYRLEADIRSIRSGGDGPVLDKLRDESRRRR